jgi:hypothetical protein
VGGEAGEEVWREGKGPSDFRQLFSGLVTNHQAYQDLLDDSFPCANLIRIKLIERDGMLSAPGKDVLMRHIYF